MPAGVYLETSFVSAIVTDRSDPASVYRRETSWDWWKTQGVRYELFVSAEVVAELKHPRYPHGDAAIQLVRGVPLLSIDDEVRGFAEVLVREKVMPAPIAGDAVHVATATVHGVEYILTWNVRHLANPSKMEHLRTICLRFGLLPPQIVTPEILWEEEHE
jgi:hypothetical protein